jgi:hypothetical protein
MRIDSNSIQVPFEAINHIDTTYLTHQTQVKNNQVIKDIHSIGSYDLPVGLGGISIDNNRQVVNISGSAKLLGENYLNGINKNTFAQYIDTINQLGIIELDVYKTFEKGIYHKIDTTNNIDMGLVYDLNSQWSDILGYLCIAKMNDRFDIDDYDKKHNQGITYKGNQQEKNRLIIYRKYLDLSKTTDKKGISNKQFFSSIKNPVKFLESTKNILRVETNHTTHRSIKSRHNVGSNTIMDVLTNGVNYNPYMLDKITQPHRQNQLLMVFNEYNPDSHSIQDVIQLEGIKNIIRSANYDESTLKKFVKRYTTESMFRWWWYGGKKSVIPFRPLIDELRKKDANKDPQVNQVLEYIRQSMLSDKVA